jgi:1,4-alpha-glucan branching enzyme
MIAPDFYPVWSGVGSYRIELIKHLSKEINVHVITTRRRIKNREAKIGVKDRLVFNKFDRDVNIHFISPAENTFLYHANFQWACYRTLPQFQKQFQFDLIHTDFPLMSDILLQVLAKMNMKTVSTVHTTIEGQNIGVRNAKKNLFKLGQSDVANLFLVLPLRACEYIYLKRVPNLIATSNYIKEELQRYFGFVKNKNIPVIHYGIDTKLFSPSSSFSRKDLEDIASFGRPVVLFTGRFVASKGIYTLINAIPDVLEVSPSALFLFVGGGDCTQYIQELERNGVPKENFAFLGYVDYFDMPQVYSLASIYVAPTLYESFPLRVLEAMSCKSAVIASDVCGIPEMIQHGYNGLLVQPNDHKALAKHIIMLLEDDNFTKKLGKRARDTIIKKFSGEIMASKTLDVFKRILDF